MNEPEKIVYTANAHTTGASLHSQQPNSSRLLTKTKKPALSGLVNS